MKQKYIYGLAGLLLLLLGWQLGTALLSQRLPMASMLAPAKTWESFTWLISSGEIFPHLWASLQRIAVGLLAALVIGVPLGLLLGFSKHLEMLFARRHSNYYV